MISKNTLTGFLIISAVFLSCLLIFFHTLEPSVSRAATVDRAGAFIAATATSNPGEDLLWVANPEVHRLVVYGADMSGRITVLASADLTSVFQRPRRLTGAQ